MSELQPGETLRVLRDGTVLITHPDRKPVLIHVDGTRETVDVVTPKNNTLHGETSRMVIVDDPA